MAYGVINSDLMTTSDGVSSAGLYGLKNRLINGDMRIDQRNAGASVTPTGNGYTLDRWTAFTPTVSSKFSVQQSSTTAVGFSKSLLITSLSAYSVSSSDRCSITQIIEGLNVSDLAWGTANAATVTLSFKVRSSLTGTFGGSIQNGTANRSYPFTFTISSANTFETKSITIAGDTTGTWATDNTAGIYINFGIGVGSTYSGTSGTWAAADYRSATGATSLIGTNAATLYITGVQLEKGSTATSFDYRNYQAELAICQRYYFKIQATGDLQPFASGYNSSTTSSTGYTAFPVPLRTRPTALEQSGTAANYKVRHGATETVCSSVPTFSTSTDVSANTNFIVASGLTAGQGAMLWSGSSSAYLAWSAEL